MTPNPIRWPRLSRPSRKHRQLRCEFYDECLGLAAGRFWNGFSCSQCEGGEKGGEEAMEWVPLTKARICERCDVVLGTEAGSECPVCGRRDGVGFLTSWVEKTVKSRRQRREEEQENGTA
jgi:hypothetical protein